MCFVNTCAHTPPHQPCRAAFLFSDANFIPSQLVFSQGFSMQSQMGVLPAASLFLCVSMCLHAVGDCRGFSLLAVVASHLLLYMPTLCTVSTVEFSRCSIACGLVSIGCLWGISATVDSACIDWCGLNPAAQSSRSINVFLCLLVRGYSI